MTLQLQKSVHDVLPQTFILIHCASRISNTALYSNCNRISIWRSQIHADFTSFKYFRCAIYYYAYNFCNSLESVELLSIHVIDWTFWYKIENTSHTDCRLPFVPRCTQSKLVLMLLIVVSTSFDNFCSSRNDVNNN